MGDKLTTVDLSSLTSNEANAVSQINSNFAKVEDAIDKLLSRDGASPNAMQADLDMNSNDVLNVNTLFAKKLVLDGKVLVPVDVVGLIDDLGTNVIYYVIDGGGLAITDGYKGAIGPLPWNSTLVSASIYGSPQGSISVDVWKAPSANFPLTVANSITGGNPLVISNNTKNMNASTVGWTKQFNAGDIVGFKVNSAASITNITIALKVIR